MMIGYVDLVAIALGILVALVAPFVLLVAFMTADAPGAPPAYTIMGTGVALVALLAWWLDHPFQFLGGIALPVAGFVAYVAISNLKEYLQRLRKSGGAGGKSV